MTNHLLQLQRGLQLHVLEGDAAIASAVDDTANVSAATRLKIYFDAYRLRLIECLQANFPVLAQLLGDAAFSKLAQQYLIAHPSRHYSVRWFGHRLGDFLAANADYRDQPWLTELAAWEWTIAASFDAPDARVLEVDALVSVAPDDWATLSFAFHPSVHRVKLTTNVVAIVKAAANEEALPPPALLETESHWLVWRQQLTVQYRSIDTVERAALDSVMSGRHFGDLCEAIAAHIGTEEAPLRAATLLKRWLMDECLTELRTLL